MRKILLPVVGCTAALLAATPSHADITGSIDAVIVLEAGCIINGVNFSDGASAPILAASISVRKTRCLPRLTAKS